MAARLEVAGVDGWLGARELMAVKVLLAAVAVLAGAAPGGRLGVLGLLLAPTFAFLLPDLLLAQRARRRAAHLRAEVPQVIDRVRLAVGAGLAPGRALEHAARHGDGPLAQELR
ncbi:MAG: hypothetical protein F2796_03825, partial [Actinobacteria bacterium]|nr:hypothetical protein [Actinomycetota bacterium]